MELLVSIAVLTVVSALSLAFLDPDLMQERMRPGGRRVGLRFLPITLLLFAHWAVAGLDRGRLHVSAAEGVRAAVFAHAGFAITSEWMFAPEIASGAVRVALEDWELPPMQL